ncbi:MAG: 2Fe-2S iron-sulfur cluster binding domain-containing protein [Pirellulaceae bacterium]|nr:2Fe-2S iron-sulfur cluster binding domain-containing protein [Pirellulaceae bacterium]
MHLTFLVIALGLIVTSAGHFTMAGVTWQRIRHRQQTRRQRQFKKLRSATRIARLTSELESTTAPGHAGEWRVMEVAKVVQESLDVRSFYLSDPYGQPLPGFFPGQYLLVRPALAGAYQSTRCYSLSVAPNDKMWRITVKRQPSDKPLRVDRKSGGLSNWLHDNIRDGDCLLIGGPAGHFYLPLEFKGPLVLLAAGVGITPMASMMQHSIFHTPTRPVWLHYQVTDLHHWPLGPEVHAVCQNRSHVQAITYVSRGTLSSEASHQVPADQFRAGKIDIRGIASEKAGRSAHYYMCGPESWMDSMRQELLSAGIQEAHIHWESFGGAAPSIGGDVNPAQAHAVRFHKSQTDTRWSSPDQSLWELAQASDVTIASGCLSGVCGCCRVKLLKGSVAYDRKISVSLADGECLTCVARPTSDVVLDA